MYFPNLFGRQEELLALRHAAENLPNFANTTVPIVEPCASNPAKLIKCLESLGERGVSLILITNPNVGEFKNTSAGDFLTKLSPLFAKYSSILPGLRCTAKTSVKEVQAFLKDYKKHPVALLYSSSKFTNEELKVFVEDAQIAFHVNLHGTMSSAQRSLLPKKRAVDVHDRFHSQSKNADYDGVEFFTEHHTSYSKNSGGFGDFSVIGCKFVKGGGKAHAVAIHLVYSPADSNEIWVEHFVSDDTDVDVGSTASKYLQAAAKALQAADNRPGEFYDSSAFQGYAVDVDAKTSHGLGVNKRRMIIHHLEHMHDFFS